MKTAKLIVCVGCLVGCAAPPAATGGDGSGPAVAPMASVSREAVDENKASAAEPSMATMGTDCHMHVRPAADGASTHDAEHVRAVLREAGLARACLLSSGFHLAKGCADFTCTEQRAWTQAANDWTLQQAATDVSLLGFCGIPIGPAWASDEVDRCAASGARGLKLHVVSQKLHLTHPDVAKALQEIAARAAEHGLPILIHVGQGAEEIGAFFRVAEAAPQTTFVAAHGLLSSIKLLPDAPPNVHIEISGLTLAPKQAGEFFASAWRGFGISRILFGSDWPTMGLHPRTHLEWLESYPLTADERDQILWKNAALMFPAIHAPPTAK